MGMIYPLLKTSWLELSHDLKTLPLSPTMIQTAKHRRAELWRAIKAQRWQPDVFVCYYCGESLEVEEDVWTTSVFVGTTRKVVATCGLHALDIIEASVFRHPTQVSNHYKLTKLSGVMVSEVE